MSPDDADAEPDDLGALAEAFAAQVESTSGHPITPTSTSRLREVLATAFVSVVADLGGTTEQETTTGTSSTRTAESAAGRVVLHETTSLGEDGEEGRTTIALTGSSSAGERFWLGATSHAAGPVARLELAGDLPDFAAPVLAQVLLALRTPSPG